MTNTQPTHKSKPVLSRVIKYGWILNHLPFFLFLALLAIIYIANGHWADKTIRNISKTTKQVKELEYEYKSLKSMEMFKSRESQIIHAAAPLGLKISTEQLMRVIVNVDTAAAGRSNKTLF